MGADVSGGRLLEGTRGGSVVSGAVQGSAESQLYLVAWRSALQRHVSDRGADEDPCTEAARVSISASRRTALHDVVTSRAGARLHLCGDDRGSIEAVLHSDVFAHAGRTHHPGKLLQSADI